MSHASVDELLERGRIALAGLRYREQAALYRAAATSLQSALRSAEGGESIELEVWLENNREYFYSMELDSIVPGSAVPDALRFPAASDSSPLSAAVAGSEEKIEFPTTFRRQEPADSKPTVDEDLLNLTVPESSDSFYESELNHVPHLVSSPGDFEIAAKPEELRHFYSDLGTSDSSERGISDDEWEEVEKAGTHHPLREAPPRWRTVFTPPIWLSIGVHSLVIGGLSLVVIQQIREKEVTAIVSAPYESDAILTETPMEVLSDSDLSSLAALEAPAAMLTGASVGESSAIPALPAIDMPHGLSGGMAGIAKGITSESLSSALSGSSGGASGTKSGTGAEFFGVKAVGNLFIYIVDCSPSMRRDNAFEAAKFEIARSLQSMKTSQRYYIYFFGKEVERLELSSGVAEEFPVQATEENVRRTMEWLGRTAIQREGLPPNDVLSEAIKLQPDGIFLLFDGDTRVDVAKHLGQVNRTTDILNPGEPKVPIHVVHFFLENYAVAMQQVAQENNGTYRFIPRQKRNSFTKR